MNGAAAMQPNRQAGPHANSRAPMTLVTAYFALPRRSRSIHDYHQWMANLLPFVEWPMVIFCDAASLDIIKRLRGQKPAVYCVTRLEDFSVYRYRDSLHAHVAQRLGRPAGQTIGFDAALVWHEKAHFVRRAIDMNAFDSRMFFWCDIGLLRGGVFRPSARVKWPDFQVCRTTLGNQVAFFGRHIAPPPHLAGGDPLDFRAILGRLRRVDAPLLRRLLPPPGTTHQRPSAQSGGRFGTP